MPIEPMVFQSVTGGAFKRGDIIEPTGEPVVIDPKDNPDLYERIRLLSEESK